MPVYLYKCDTCGIVLEKLHRTLDEGAPDCCATTMRKIPTCQAMIKMKGMGGYPSRRKQFKGTAPYTSRSTKPYSELSPQAPDPNG